MQTYEEAIKSVVSILKPKTVLELGTGYGISGGVFLDCGAEKLVSVDKLPVSKEKEKVVRHLKKGQELIFLQEDTMRAETKDKLGMFDFVYVDAGHTYEECKNDMEIAKTKLNDGGAMLIHDYTHANNNIPEGQSDCYGVRKAVDEFVLANRDDIEKRGVIFEEHNNSFYI